MVNSDPLGPSRPQLGFVAKGFEEPQRVYEVRWREDAGGVG
jgi:hypothetical protein